MNAPIARVVGGLQPSRDIVPGRSKYWDVVAFRLQHDSKEPLLFVSKLASYGEIGLRASARKKLAAGFDLFVLPFDKGVA